MGPKRLRIYQTCLHCGTRWTGAHPCNAAQARLVAEEELNVRNAASASLRVAALEAEIMGMRAEIARWKQLLDDEEELNANNVANADLQLAELQAEPVYVCEECDNERLIELKEELAAAQAETQAMVGRLDKLAEEWQVDITWSEQVDGTFKHCADRLREAISGENKQQVGLLEIADDVIAEREAAKGER